LAWGKMMSIVVFMTNLIHLIWFQLALNKVHFPFSLALDRVSSQEIWQFMHNSQLLTVRLFFDNEWANFTGLHISKNEPDSLIGNKWQIKMTTSVLIWFQLIGYSIIDPAMKATQAK
jgi:hypothetical protein